jgi:NAD(P)H-dependent FMN reductase
MADPGPKSVAIITMSTRNPRIGPHVAAVIQELVQKSAAESNLTLEAIDLATFKLPVFDEPVIPAMVPGQASFAHEHSKAWSAAIQKHDAYVLVVPEYNYGMAGGTKNALDYLKNEWKTKPAMVVSYGIQGGKTASEQVCKVLGGMELRVTATRPNLAFFEPHGPDLYAAMLQGELGEVTRKKWSEVDKEVILKAFDELKTLLLEPVVVLEEKSA